MKKTTAIIIMAILVMATSCSMFSSQLEDRQWKGYNNGKEVAQQVKDVLDDLTSSPEYDKNYVINLYMKSDGSFRIVYGGALLFATGTWTATSSTLTMVGEFENGDALNYTSGYELGGAKLKLNTPLLGIRNFNSNGILL